MRQATDTVWGSSTQFSTGEARALSQAHLLRVFDEVDYGMLLLDPQGRILHANHLARHELAQRRVLRACSGNLMGSSAEHSERIQQALDAASRELLAELLVEASQQRRRGFVLADYALPPGVQEADLSGLIELGD